MNSLEDLLEAEKIKQLKYRYFRFLDMKQFEKMVMLFTEDGSTAYDNGRYTFQGRKAILDFMNEGLGLRESPSQHQGHHPEITLIDETHATGIWQFDDIVHRLDYQIIITGGGVYFDEYLKVDGEWLIQHTGYERLWVRTEAIPEDPNREIRVMYDEAERQMSRQRPKRAGELALFPNDLVINHKSS